MTKPAIYPVFKSINEAQCFRCNSPLDASTVRESGYPTGQYEAACPACKMHTWFDFKAA